MPTVQLRDDYDAAELRRLAKRSRDNRQIRRLLALAAVYDGMSRADAAQIGGMDRQTLRDWAHRFNAEGAEGLTDRPRPGRERRLSGAQMAEQIGRASCRERVCQCALTSVGAGSLKKKNTKIR